MSGLATRVRREDGYSLIEIMVVIGIMGVVGGMAVAQLATTRNVVRGDAAMRQVISQLNLAQQQAITQRRYIEVTFDTTHNWISIIREDTTTTTTTLSTTLFEGGAVFGLTAGLPDTPDAFGNSAATCFSNSTNGTFASATGSTKVAKFAPDGTLVDWNGITTNGTVFTTIPNTSPVARAVTVLGSTGRIRGFRWDGRQWVKV